MTDSNAHVVYVDWSNLKFGCLEGTRWKWLDLVVLFKSVLPTKCGILAVNTLRQGFPERLTIRRSRSAGTSISERCSISGPRLKYQGSKPRYAKTDCTVARTASLRGRQTAARSPICRKPATGRIDSKIHQSSKSAASSEIASVDTSSGEDLVALIFGALFFQATKREPKLP